LSDDPEARAKALKHLWSAIIHQGTPWTATGPVAQVIVGLLADSRIDRGDSIRADLLSFLVAVADAPRPVDASIEELERLAEFDIEPFLDSDDEDALYENDDATNSFYARSILGCIKVAPVLMNVMLDELADANHRVRACAAMGATRLARTDALRSRAADIESRVLVLARSAQDADERAAHVLALGELGFSPAEFLGDPSPAVRMCAAMAPSLADDPTALFELLGALEHHAGDIDQWFVATPPQFSMRPRFSVVARLVQQVPDFDWLANAAVAVAGIAGKHFVDFDWGPLLAKAFPDGNGLVTTDAQRRFLAALVDNAKLWDPKYGNPWKWFQKAGLTYDRAACAERVERAS
jgi:hypothetical protein